MPVDLLPMISYVLISTFTPGPSNISSASMAVLHGYRNTLRFQLGLAAGVFLLMFLSGWLSGALLRLFPPVEPVLRYAGAAYILYLAFAILKATYAFAGEEAQPLGVWHGLTLQVLNPKLVVYAFTLFSGFLASVSQDLARVAPIALALAAVSFAATSTWALFGTVIKAHLHDRRWRTGVNIALAALLIYAAASLARLV